MAVLKRSGPPKCPVGKNCSEWAIRYMKYCLCSTKNGVSLTLGMISVMSWGVAEIPQIITNYKQKSTEGLSLAFLLTWILGNNVVIPLNAIVWPLRFVSQLDLLNLFGCMLEPATLPTQFYMAILYTLTSSILAAQAIYYGYIYQRLKSNMQHDQVIPIEAEEDNYGIDKKELRHVGFLASGVTASSPIPLPARPFDVSTGGELYYRSARSLSMSHTPTAGSCTVQRMTSESDLNATTVPLLGGGVSTRSAPSPDIKAMLCVVFYMTFLLGSLNFQKSESSGVVKLFQAPLSVGQQVERKLLQANGVSVRNSSSMSTGGIGTLLGWGMATIYMGGRLPQIFLNIRRGNVEGLNPLMFLFALLGNTTYVASILINSLDWSKVRPNLPWLVDAVGCVLLDTLIVIQFVYFRYRVPQNAEIRHI